MVSSQDGSDMIYNYRFTYFGPLQMAKSENKQHKSRCLIAVHVPFLQCDVSSIWRDFPINDLPLTFYHLYFVTFTESSRSSVDVLSGIFCIWYHFPRELLFSLPISQPESSIVRGGGVGSKRLHGEKVFKKTHPYWIWHCDNNDKGHTIGMKFYEFTHFFLSLFLFNWIVLTVYIMGYNFNKSFSNDIYLFQMCLLNMLCVFFFCFFYTWTFIDLVPSARSDYRILLTKRLHWKECQKVVWSIYVVFCHTCKINPKTVWIWISMFPFKVRFLDALCSLTLSIYVSIRGQLPDASRNDINDK